MSVVDRIKQLKEERNAVILVHNYQSPEVQDIADYTGDSLGLSREAAATNADVIVFCGVYFMAETAAKILSPQKTVLIPDKTAGCPMADMITVDQLLELKAKHPKAKVMCYVNSSAEVKAESDLCCTSANAIDLLTIGFDEDDEIIFVPDKYLGSYSARITGRNVIFWPGFCPSHLKILPEHIIEQKKLHPDAKVMVHPECSAGVVNLADAVVSTGGMTKYAKESGASEFIVGTEVGMVYPLKKQFPDKEFYVASDIAVCPNMKKTTLAKVLNSLENDEYKVELTDEVMDKARGSIENMLALTNKANTSAKA